MAANKDVKTRRLPGAGHVRERTLKNGDLRFDVLVRDNGKQQTLRTCRSRADADATLYAWLCERADNGEDVPDDLGILTVRQLGELYLDSLSEIAQRTSRSRWKARVEEMADFIDWPVSQVTDMHVSDWIDQMCSTPIREGKSAGQRASRSTVQNAVNLLRDCFRWARIKRYTTHNPVVGVTIRASTASPPKKKSGRRFDYLHEDEVRLIVNAELPADKRAAFLLLAFTGARPKDLYLLTWDRVDVRGGTIRYLSHKTQQEYLVHLLPIALKAIKEWWLARGQPRVGLVFPSEGGKPHATGYDWQWADKRERKHLTWKRKRTGDMGHRQREEITVVRGWRSKMGIKRPLPLYSLRHTCACQLMLGADLFTGGRAWRREEIQSQLGHTSSKTTEFYMVALGLASKRAVEESREAIRGGGRKSVGSIEDDPEILSLLSE